MCFGDRIELTQINKLVVTRVQNMKMPDDCLGAFHVTSSIYQHLCALAPFFSSSSQAAYRGKSTLICAVNIVQD